MEDPNSYAARSRAAYSSQQGVSGIPYSYNGGGNGPPAYRPTVAAQPSAQPSAQPTSQQALVFPPVVATLASGVSSSSSAEASLKQIKHKLGQEAYAMKRSMDQPPLQNAHSSLIDSSISIVLDHCVNMLSELVKSSSVISPKQYYEIHMFVLNQMQFVEEYFENLPQETRNIVTLKDIYEICQYCPKVVQRSYLMVAAGSCLLKQQQHKQAETISQEPSIILDMQPSTISTLDPSQAAPTIVCLDDSTTNSTLSNRDQLQLLFHELMETVKGVQCPLRGLFLRHYLLQATRDKLPDGLNFDISHKFILQNLDEMNRLWIRIQQMPGNHTKQERKKRERERSELRLLVGSNLERLSQLDGITLEIYQSTILPHVLQQITDCNDTLAQAYLLDCCIQVFPNNFHLQTLEALLSVLPLLKEKVNVRNILQNIMNRLALPKEEGEGDSPETRELRRWNYYQNLSFDPFQLFDQCVRQVNIKKGNKIGLKEMIRLEVTLLEFALHMPIDPADNDAKTLHIGHTNHCLAAVLRDYLQPNKSNREALEDPAVAEQLENLLNIPTTCLGLQKLLDLPHYAEVLSFLPSYNRKQIALNILHSATGLTGDNTDKLERLYGILKPVICEPVPDFSMSGDQEDYRDKLDLLSHEQGFLLGRLVHSFESHDTDTLFKMYTIARKHLVLAPKEHLAHTLVPLLYDTIKLVYRVHTLEFPTLPNIVTSAPQGFQTKTLSSEKVEIAEETAYAVTEGESQSASFSPEENKPYDIEDSLFSSTPVNLPPVPPPPPPQPSFDKMINCRKLFVFLQKVIASLAPHYPELGMQLYLEVAIVADRCGFIKEQNHPSSKFSKATFDHKSQEELSLFQDSTAMVTVTNADFSAMTFEFVTQALQVYEDELTDSKAQLRCLTLLIGTLLRLSILTKSDYQTLITKTAQLSAKLIRKPDQSRLVALCSLLFDREVPPLFGGETYSNPQRVLECLQRSLKLADMCYKASINGSSLELFVDVLELYVYYFCKQMPSITNKFVSGLVALINEHIDNSKDFSDQAVQAQTHYRNILTHIDRQKVKESSGDSEKRFDKVII